MASSGDSDSPIRVVIVPGNGGVDVSCDNWYDWLAGKLRQAGFKCELRNMPDPVDAKESVWIPFMKNDLLCDESTIIVGHSSGAQAAMRYAESYKVHGIVVVSACVTDLGMPQEAASGYYNRPWQWDLVKANTKVRGQFGSLDDPFMSWSEQQQVAEGLGSDLHKFEDRGHFMSSRFPELLKYLTSLLKDAEKS